MRLFTTFVVALILFGLFMSVGSDSAKVTPEMLADHTITLSPNLNGLIFSENWPLDYEICVPEGCITIGALRDHLKSER